MLEPATPAQVQEAQSRFVQTLAEYSAALAFNSMANNRLENAESAVFFAAENLAAAKKAG